MLTEKNYQVVGSEQFDFIQAGNVYLQVLWQSLQDRVNVPIPRGALPVKTDKITTLVVGIGHTYTV